MATKKKQAAPKAAAPAVEPAPAPRTKRPAALSTERTHALRRDQLTRYRMLEAEARAAQAEFQLADLRFNTLIHSRPEVVAAQTSRAAAQETFRRRREDYRAYVDELGKLLGLDMKNVAIDDETGTVRPLHDGPDAPATD